MNEKLDQMARELGQWIKEGGRLWLFLDYDGTLEDFAPNPDVLLPDPDLISLIQRLALFPDCLRVVVISGRRYSHIQKLLPVPGVLLAGTYGIEYTTWEGDPVCLINYETERPVIDQVKTLWKPLVENKPGFYLEDKGYALALHARDAPDRLARDVIGYATHQALTLVAKGTMRLRGGSKFLEVAPRVADKGQSVGMLLTQYTWPNAKLVYIGDDDKDEDAFLVIQSNGGTAILVSREDRPSLARDRLEDPAAVRDWLRILAEMLET